MRRHLDDHPSLNSSGGDFNSNSLPLSATNTTNSNSPIFPDIDARAGASDSNIRWTTSLTTTTSITVNSAFHSTRTLNAPASPGAGNNHNKPLISRQPRALIQETVHAAGSSSNSEMQSSVQFPLSSGFQARVTAATTLSQGDLGHAQSSSSVHHALPGQTQAHSNTQIVHCLQQANSQSHVGGTQMQGHQFQKLKVEKSYLDQVKYKFRNQPQVYKNFLDIMKEFKYQSIDTPGVIQRISNLFRGHPELIVGFLKPAINTLVPLGYRIEVQPNEQVQSSTHTPPVANSQPHTNSQSQHVYNQNSPAHTQSSGGSPGVHSPSSTPQASQAACHVTKVFLKKVKNRFHGQPDSYKQFSEIISTYRKKQRSLKDGVLLTKPWMEMYAQVAKLFRNEDDLLLQELGEFIPDGVDASALVDLMAPPQWAYQVENFINEPDEELVCSICQAIFCDPVICPCDHVFCRACITKWLQSSRNCPICRNQTSLVSIKQTVPIIKNLIKKLMLNCHNKNLGCKAQFSVENSVSHMKECEYELVQCKNEPCKDQLFRKDLTEDKTRDCPHRYIKCKKCRLKIPATVLPEKHDCIEALQARLREKSELIKKNNMRIRQLRNEELSASSAYLSSDSDERDAFSAYLSSDSDERDDHDSSENNIIIFTYNPYQSDENVESEFSSDFMDNETSVEYSRNESPQATAEYRNVESQTLDDLPSNVQQQHSDIASGDNSSFENENTAAEASNSGETGEGSCPRRPVKRRPTTQKPAKRRYPQVFVSSEEEEDDESEQHSSPETDTRGAENDQGDNSGMTAGLLLKQIFEWCA